MACTLRSAGYLKNKYVRYPHQTNKILFIILSIVRTRFSFSSANINEVGFFGYGAYCQTIRDKDNEKCYAHEVNVLKYFFQY